MKLLSTLHSGLLIGIVMFSHVGLTRSGRRRSGDATGGRGVVH